MRLSDRFRRLTLWNKLGVLGSLASLLGLAIYFLPVRSRVRTLTDQEKRAVVALLRNAPASRPTVRLSCPPADEASCVLAGELFDQFRAGGWSVVGTGVQRGTLGKLKPGVVLLVRGATADDPIPPGGVWVEQTASLRVAQAAVQVLGLPVQQAADARQPEGVITIFVGPK